MRSFSPPLINKVNVKDTHTPQWTQSASLACETKKEIAMNATRINAKTTAKKQHTKRSSVLWMSMDDKNKNATADTRI